VNDPILLMADEPTGNLDSKTGQAILAIFDELVAQGKTVIMVTHDPSVAHRCHRVLHLHDGVVQRDERNARHPVSVEAGQLSVLNVEA
jgi:putative ABC transport system ATP-binding protein